MSSNFIVTPHVLAMETLYWAQYRDPSVQSVIVTTGVTIDGHTYEQTRHELSVSPRPFTKPLIFAFPHDILMDAHWDDRVRREVESTVPICTATQP